MKREVSALLDPERARFLQHFFRTGPGEYAEGDWMLGLTVPDQRQIARAYRNLSLGELQKLLQSPFHEHRLIALLILVDQHERASDEQQPELHRFYLDHLSGINNWDLVDASAATLVGEHRAENKSCCGSSRRLRCGIAGSRSSAPSPNSASAELR